MPHSFNVKDIHTVDNGVIEHLVPAIEQATAARKAARASKTTYAVPTHTHTHTQLSSLLHRALLAAVR